MRFIVSTDPHPISFPGAPGDISVDMAVLTGDRLKILWHSIDVDFEQHMARRMAQRDAMGRPHPPPDYPWASLWIDGGPPFTCQGHSVSATNDITFGDWEWHVDLGALTVGVRLGITLTLDDHVVGFLARLAAFPDGLA